MKKVKKRNGFLDFLKFVFALIIVIGHGDTIYGTLPKNKLIPLASFGVEFFFIVSGAMLLKSFKKQRQGSNIGTDTFNFMKHKIKGLLPNYYVAWIILFIFLNVDNSFKGIVYNFLRAIPELLFLKMSGIPTQVYNGNTWYISAMLLAFVIIYPLIRKNKDFFIKFIAPVIIIFGLGCITHNFHTILVIEEWNGFLYYGLIRAVVDICIGCLVYELSTKIKKINLTTFGKIVITFLEIFLYLSVIIMLFSYGFRRYCYVLLFILMIPISITLADISLTKHVFSYKIFNWLGKYSYSLYLCHSIAYSHFIGQHFFNSKFSYFETMSIYFVVALISGLCIMYLSKLISYIWSKLGNKIKRLVIAEN